MPSPHSRRRTWLLIEAVVCVALAGAYLIHRQTSSTDPARAQRTVDAFVAAQPELDLPMLAELLRTGTATNKPALSSCVAALDALSLQPGYELDWFYFRNGGGGKPVLYARQHNEAPVATLEDLRIRALSEAWLDGVPSDEEIRRQLWYGYLDRIQVEDSAEGFFQLALLYLLGDRFCLLWHEFYGEVFVICSDEGLRSVLERQKERKNETPSPDRLECLKQMDLRPRVALGQTNVQVSVITYRPFGGIDHDSIWFSREPPHRILRHASTNLLEQSQPFLF